MQVTVFLRRWSVVLVGLVIVLIGAGLYQAHDLYDKQLLVVEREGIKLCPHRRDIPGDHRQFIYDPHKPGEFDSGLFAFTLLKGSDPQTVKLTELGALKFKDEGKLVVNVALARPVEKEPPAYGPRQLFEGNSLHVGRNVEFAPSLGLYRLNESATQWYLSSIDPVTTPPHLQWNKLREALVFSCLWINPKVVQHASCSHTIRIGDVLAGYTIPENAVPLYKELDEMIVRRVQAFRDNCRKS